MRRWTIVEPDGTAVCVVEATGRRKALLAARVALGGGRIHYNGSRVPVMLGAPGHEARALKAVRGEGGDV